MSCATLIIEDANSALQILMLIKKYERVFAVSPILVLIHQKSSDVGDITKLAKKYSIKSIPALISPSGKVFTGNAQICKRIPLLARDINEGTRDPSQAHSRAYTHEQARNPEELLESYYTSAVRESPEEEAFDDDATPGSSKSFEEKRRDYYRRTQRGPNMAPGASGAPGAPGACSGASSTPGTGACRTPPATAPQTAAPRTASSRAPTVANRGPAQPRDLEDKFAEAFQAMQEETPLDD